MPKLIFDFETQEELDDWYGMFLDGGGEQEIMAGYDENEMDYPAIEISEEK